MNAGSARTAVRGRRPCGNIAGADRRRRFDNPVKAYTLGARGNPFEDPFSAFWEWNTQEDDTVFANL